MNGAAGAALRVGIVAGESSGDQLGAALIQALRERVPALECFGVAGPKMIAVGCQAWARAEDLSVMGLFEVIPHLPRLLRVRRALVARDAGHQRQVIVVASTLVADGGPVAGLALLDGLGVSGRGWEGRRASRERRDEVRLRAAIVSVEVG